MDNNWERINQESERLVKQITSTLRGVDEHGRKIIDHVALQELFDLLERIVDSLQDQETVNKRFVALMFYLYGQIQAEAKFTDFPEPIFILAGEVEDYTDKLFGKYFD